METQIKTSKRKPFNNKLGYVCSLKTKKGWVVIYDNKDNQLGVDSDNIRWIAVKEYEGTMMTNSSLKLARETIKMWREEDNGTTN